MLHSVQPFQCLVWSMVENATVETHSALEVQKLLIKRTVPLPALEMETSTVELAIGFNFTLTI